MASTASSKTQTISSLPSLTPQRIQTLKTFLSSDETIMIIPTFSYKSPLDFLLTQEPIPPLQPGIEATVPLWLAIYLRKRNLCRLKCPSWMAVSHLKSILAHERDRNQDSFSKDLPFRHAEISRAILQVIGASRSAVHASGGSGGNEEVPQVELVRVLLEDIAMVRMDKIRRNLHAMSAETMGNSLEMPMPVLDVTGIGSMEMAAVKPFLEGAFEDHLKLVKAGTVNGSAGTGKDSSGATSRNLPVSTRKSRRENTARTNVADEDEDEDEDEEHEHDDRGGGDGNKSDGMDSNLPSGNDEEQDLDANSDADDAPVVSKSRIRRYR